MGVAGMAFNVRLMPVKVVDTEWDYIFDSPFIGTDDTVARGDSLRGRQRRAGHQSQSRPRG
jgi:hypothetical protein